MLTLKGNHLCWLFFVNQSLVKLDDWKGNGVGFMCYSHFVKVCGFLLFSDKTSWRSTCGSTQVNAPTSAFTATPSLSTTTTWKITCASTRASVRISANTATKVSRGLTTCIDTSSGRAAESHAPGGDGSQLLGVQRPPATSCVPLLLRPTGSRRAGWAPHTRGSRVTHLGSCWASGTEVRGLRARTLPAGRVGRSCGQKGSTSRRRRSRELGGRGECLLLL